MTTRCATETLTALRARTHLVAACIYKPDITIFARYARPGAPQACPTADSPEGIRFSSTELTAAGPILLKGRRQGTLILLYDLGEIDERRRLYGATVLAVLLASSLIAFLHELGVLVDTFNEMLTGIQSRDDELRVALLAREVALKEVQSTRDSLETTLASIGDAVISTNVEGRVVFANRIALALLRYQDADVLGKHLDDVFQIVNEFTRERVESPVAKVLREGDIVAMANHTILIAKDGTETPIDDSGAPIRGEKGPIQGTVLVFRDVTARRRADETSRLLGSIVESSADAIIGKSLLGVVTSWNKGAQDMYGCSSEEMIGQPISILSPPEYPDDMPAILERVRKGVRIEQYETVRRTKDGRLINVALSVSPLRDSLGRIVGASRIARDITAQVRAASKLAQLNADLQQSNENLARSNEDLERFAFVACHDLQEPLRMITVYSQLPIKTYPAEIADHDALYVGNIVEGTKRMRELLADLRAYTEIGAPQETPVETIDLQVVIETVAHNLQPATDDAGAVITTSRLPVLKASSANFISLFQNLIGNALKYRDTEPPRINVSVAEMGRQVQFTVSDNGIGIEPEYCENIFVPFKRLHGKQIPGTGIGLAICQRVVERYGGRIWVESAPGRGSSFFFTLPCNIVSRKEAE